MFDICFNIIWVSSIKRSQVVVVVVVVVVGQNELLFYID
jgi:hypothetical protein